MRPFRARRAGKQRPRAPKGRPYATRVEGLWVRSAAEARIANWLSRQQIPFVYEAPVAGKRPDFLVDDGIVVEYWGGSGWRRYEDKMVEKTALFEAAGFPVVHLLPVHLRELEAELGRRLRELGVQFR